MKLSIQAVLILLFLFLTQTLLAQDSSSKIYVIRSTGYAGSALAFKVLIDDTLVCKLKNKRFSTHSATIGEHTIAVQNTGLSAHETSPSLTLKIEPGKNTYVKILLSSGKLSVKEVTEFSAKDDMKGLTEMLKCADQ